MKYTRKTWVKIELSRQLNEAERHGLAPLVSVLREILFSDGNAIDWGKAADHFEKYNVVKLDELNVNKH